MDNEHFIATIHGGMWEVIPDVAGELEKLAEVNRQIPGEFIVLGVFSSWQEAVDACAERVPPLENAKRQSEVCKLFERLAALRRHD
jgi:hypothetical protein